MNQGPVQTFERLRHGTSFHPLADNAYVRAFQDQFSSQRRIDESCNMSSSFHQPSTCSNPIVSASRIDLQLEHWIQTAKVPCSSSHAVCHGFDAEPYASLHLNIPSANTAKAPYVIEILSRPAFDFFLQRFPSSIHNSLRH